MSDQTEDQVEKEESSADCWRRLALQFDNHRMTAIGHLKAMLADPVAAKEEAIKFVQAAPLSGTEVLKQRIAEIAASTEGALPKGWRLLKDTTFDERKWPEDASHENGNYCNTCGHCGREFVGHKRRGLCRACAKPQGESNGQT